MNCDNLDPKVAALWAKKGTSSTGEPVWLPLLAHLIDTANVINALYNHCLSDGQRALLVSDGQDEESVRQTIQFIGFIHDLGKATAVFERKQSYDHNAELDQAVLEHLIRAGFTGLDTAVIAHKNESPHARAGEALLEKFGVSSTIGAIIGGHHGKPEKGPPKNDICDFTANYFQDDGNKLIQQKWQDVQKEILEFGLNYVGLNSVQELADFSQKQSVIVEGLLIMADWLASSEYLENNRSDHPLFPLIAVDETIANIDFDTRFKNAWLAWTTTDEPILQQIKTSNDPYFDFWHFHARKFQTLVTEAIDKAVDPSLVIIEAPMGAGKTEISLVAAQQLAFRQGEMGLYYGLPTQATSNAMFERIKDWLDQQSKKSGLKNSIKLMHGRAEFNESYRALPNATGVDNQSGAVVNSWFSGKKSILDEYVVGTIDNLLLFALKQKHLALRHLGMSRKVVVIDEVHAYDTYMNVYLDRALEWLGAYHVPVVMLSATLPAARRRDLVLKYYKGRFGAKKYLEEKEATNSWQKNIAYPLVTLLDGDRVQQFSETPTPEQRKQVEVELMSDELADLVSSVLEKTADGGVVGVIVNTVARAQAIGYELDGKAPTLVLHSAFVATERTKIENELLEKIGKNGQRPEKLVIIGTQVLEQSLDIDFDILYTDLAPMDLILQRVGRLQRHQNKRPKQLSTPQLVVMDGSFSHLGEFNEGSEAIYGRYLLMKTRYYLPQVLNIPADIPRLTQLVYDEVDDALNGEIDGLQEAKKKEAQVSAELEKKAGVYPIDPPSYVRNKSIHGWLDNPKAIFDDEMASRSVRNIVQDSIEVLVLKKDSEGQIFLLDGTKIVNENLHIQAKAIAMQILRLTVSSYKIIDTIKILEKFTRSQFPDWADNKWLRGALAIVLDEQNEVEVGGVRYRYSTKFGLTKERING
ncbi:MULTISPECIES: CRISPR-associated helicase/endonuclease Cas3 [Amylolactobacillus]|uniref:CRISPR-associated helicase/endonuclease Cas3 n=1 Tax=Amylolactobacillus amylophilus DSM 20533 = JCM 1125 TaxID=1423721 RepID=A0A1L6XCK6_9LACO|nr:MULTISPECIES: CRISPR-associated helicase/endonuclease Cas3 [Amylolactobacillus]APT18711.1 hypothetical protein LA20533_05300 [Amylolactobacillus amylophilus DSM 20533 = JCM 1125]GED80621.1 CRISPR-associated helicase/endonuclease Cas3 [Amylolactobacillus amylophilus]